MKAKFLAFITFLLVSFFMSCPTDNPDSPPASDKSKVLTEGTYSIEQLRNFLIKNKSVTVNGDVKIYGTGAVSLDVEGAKRTLILNSDIIFYKINPDFYMASMGMEVPLFLGDPELKPDVIFFVGRGEISGRGHIVADSATCYFAGIDLADTSTIFKFSNFQENPIALIDDPDDSASWDAEDQGYIPSYTIGTGSVPADKTLYVSNLLELGTGSAVPNGNVVAFGSVNISGSSATLSSDKVDFSGASKITPMQDGTLNFGTKSISFIDISAGRNVSLTGNPKITGGLIVNGSLSLRAGTFTIADGVKRNSLGLVTINSDAVIYNLDKSVVVDESVTWKFNSKSQLWTPWTPTSASISKTTIAGQHLTYVIGEEGSDALLAMNPSSTSIELLFSQTPETKIAAGTVTVRDCFGIESYSGLNVIGTLKLQQGAGTLALSGGDVGNYGAKISGTGSIVSGNLLLTAGSGYWRAQGGTDAILFLLGTTAHTNTLIGSGSTAVLKGSSGTSSAIILGGIGDTTHRSELTVLSSTIDLSEGGRIDFVGQSSSEYSKLILPSSTSVLKLDAGTAGCSSTLIIGAGGTVTLDGGSVTTIAANKNTIASIKGAGTITAAQDNTVSFMRRGGTASN